MRPRRRDRSFLFIAVLAATGGLMAIAFAIGLPIWARAHHRTSSPEFTLFAAWGIAALGGAWACLQTYLLSGDPKKPPRGGVRLRLIKTADATPSAPQQQQNNERAA